MSRFACDGCPKRLEALYATEEHGWLCSDCTARLGAVIRSPTPAPRPEPTGPWLSPRSDRLSYAIAYAEALHRSAFVPDSWEYFMVDTKVK